MKTLLSITLALFICNPFIVRAEAPTKQSLVQEGNTYLASGQYQNAVDSFTKALAKDTKDKAVVAKHDEAMNKLLAELKKNGSAKKNRKKY
jgi:Tfp pilus assembly protein PilF